MKIVKWILIIVMCFNIVRVASDGISNRIYNDIAVTGQQVDTRYISEKYVNEKMEQIYLQFYSSKTIIGQYLAYQKMIDLKVISDESTENYKIDNPFNYFIDYYLIGGVKEIGVSLVDSLKSIIYAINPLNWASVLSGAWTTITNPVESFNNALESAIISVKDDGIFYSVCHLVPDYMIGNAAGKLIFSKKVINKNLDYDESLAKNSNLNKKLATTKLVKSGDQFIVKNNKMLKPNVSYYSGDDYLYSTDEIGRISMVSTEKLKLGDSKRNSSAQSWITEKSTDDGGHLIADRFGGSGSVDNLVSMDRNVNRSAYKKIENDMAAALKDDKKVSFNVEIDYNKKSTRPQKFTINYCIEEICKKEIVANSGF